MESKTKRGQNQTGKKRGPYKSKSLSQYKDETLGKIGTSSRNAFEREVKADIKNELVEVVMYSEPKKNPKKSRTTVAGVINFRKNTISIHGSRNNTTLKETFKRAIGRSIALGRAKKHPLLVVSFTPGKAREAFYEKANELMKKPYKITNSVGEGSTIAPTKRLGERMH